MDKVRYEMLTFLWRVPYIVSPLIRMYVCTVRSYSTCNTCVHAYYMYLVLIHHMRGIIGESNYIHTYV